MFKINLTPCSVYTASKLHINNTCSNNSKKCWKKCHSKLETLRYLVLAQQQFKDAMVINEPLIDTLED